MINYGIIAAGQGSRMLREGVAVAKPLVLIDGVPMIERTINAMIFLKAKRIVAVSNTASPEVGNTLQLIQATKVPYLTPIAFDSHNALHSFAAVADKFPANEPYCIATVDTVFRSERLLDLITEFEADSRYDGYMAVSTYIDDEKPLYVDVDTDGCTITDFTDDAPASPHYVSAGIYALRKSSREVLARCLADSSCGLRGFQRALVAAGLKLKAFDLGMVVDVDHASDIVTANACVSQWKDKPITKPV